MIYGSSSGSKHFHNGKPTPKSISIYITIDQSYWEAYVKVKLTCGIEVSTRRKKNLPHVHKPEQCFSIEAFPTILPFDPFACQVAVPEPTAAASQEQASSAAHDSDQEMDNILEDLDEEILE